MTNKMLRQASSENELDIQALIERRAKAVREENRSGNRAGQDSEMLMCDVSPPLLSRVLDAYMATWEEVLSRSGKPVAFDFYDVEITAGIDLAFATAIRRCAGIDANGRKDELEFRVLPQNRCPLAHCARASFTAGRITVAGLPTTELPIFRAFASTLQLKIVNGPGLVLDPWVKVCANALGESPCSRFHSG